jgi:hypothetical protein
MKTYSLRVSVPVTADCLSERRIYRTKVSEISETRILFSGHVSHKLNKCVWPLQNFLLPDHNAEMTDQGHCNTFHLQDHIGRTQHEIEFNESIVLPSALSSLL